jgi:TRAP-type C4-dicarboxylate transport system permease small subunit
MAIADRILTLILRCADSGARNLVILFAGLMVLVVSAQVVIRYVFNDSLDWADEVSRIAFVWTIFLAIPLGIRDGTHVGIELLIELLVKRFPNKLQRFVARITSGLAAVMMLVMFWSSITVALATWSERLGAIDITSSVFFFPVIFGALHSALHLIQLAIFPPESSI